MPYFDAVIEEIHRCGRTAPTLIRRTTCDTEILGYAVPEGTDVFMVRRHDRLSDRELKLTNMSANSRSELRASCDEDR